MNNKEIEFEKGQDNVFADLGLEEAEELFTRSQIGFHVYQILKEKQLKQREIAVLLGISQPDVSHFLKRLNMKVTIKISPHKNGEPYQQIAFSN